MTNQRYIYNFCTEFLDMFLFFHNKQAKYFSYLLSKEKNVKSLQNEAHSCSTCYIQLGNKCFYLFQILFDFGKIYIDFSLTYVWLKVEKNVRKSGIRYNSIEMKKN